MNPMYNLPPNYDLLNDEKELIHANEKAEETETVKANDNVQKVMDSLFNPSSLLK